MPNYLGIDYGTKRIGLAWANELGISLPIGSIPGVFNRVCWDALADEINKRQITELVVGYPIHMDGSIGKRAKEVDAFIEQLTKNFQLPVHRVDERLSSAAARESLQSKPKLKGKDTTGRVDATAACLILRDFLNS